MSKLKQILNRPFPLVETSQEKVLSALFFGAFVFVFLFLFEPFGMDRVETNKFLYNLGYGVITASVILLHGFVTMRIFSKFFALDKWVVWKSLIHNAIIILPIALLNWIYFENVFKPDDVSYSFIEFVFITMGVGILPSPLLILYFERRLSLRNKELSEKINIQLTNPKSFEKHKELVELNNEGISISAEDFLYANSMGNYITIYYFENGRQRRVVIRETMKKFEKMISVCSNISRCHRSYFVNMNRVLDSSGNARSLYLSLENVGFKIPVSRTYSKRLIEEVG